MIVSEAPVVKRLPVWRRLAGVGIGILLVADIVVYGAALLRPDLIVLRGHFANWLTGTGIMLAILFVGAIVVFPIRNPATQRIRPLIRTATFILMLLSFVFATITHGFNVFTYVPQVIAASPDGRFHAALVNNGRWNEIHVFAGSGFGERDTGSVGAPCNLDFVVFDNNTSMTVTSTDEDRILIPLDPRTGAPLAVLQRTCAFIGA